MENLLLFFIGLTLISCNQNQPISKMETNITSFNIEDYKNNCKRYGDPTQTNDFILDDGLSEFRITIYNHYKPEKYKTVTVQIKEITWNKDDDNRLTVWYGKESDLPWKKVSSLNWNQDMEF